MVLGKNIAHDMKSGAEGAHFFGALLLTFSVDKHILLTPVRMNLKDGGSVRYKALVYEVTKIHRLAPEVDGVKPYIDGFEIKILGMTVYRETNE